MTRSIASLVFVAFLAACSGASPSPGAGVSSSDGGVAGSSGDPNPSTCKVTVTGALEAKLADCIASAQHLNATNKTTLLIAATAATGTLKLAAFSATLGSAPLAAGAYTESSVEDANTQVSSTDGAVYYESIHDQAGALDDQGTFSLDVTDTGDLIEAGDSSHTDGNGWVNIHGTLSAMLPADPDGSTSGAVALRIGF